MALIKMRCRGINGSNQNQRDVNEGTWSFADKFAHHIIKNHIIKFGVQELTLPQCLSALEPKFETKHASSIYYMVVQI